MPVLAATNLTLAHGHHVVLDSVSLSVESSDRIGIVGRNGAGKSTLIKLLAGVTKPESGDVVLQRGSRSGYLDQAPKLDQADTVESAAARAFEKAHALQAELHLVFDKMGEAGEAELEMLLKEQSRLEAAIEAEGGLTTEHEVAKVLHGLGFVDAQFTLPVTALSGGQRARLGLARLLLEGPAVLLLDEPTNHLDIDGRIWLENFLADDFRGAVILISHDRYLLDRVVSRIIEVEHARLIDYPGNYADFRRIRAERRLTQYRAWEKQQSEFKKEAAYIRQYKAGQRAKQAKGRESRLDRAKEGALERPVELAELRLTLPKPRRSGDVVASARDISKVYPRPDGSGELILFKDLSIKVQRGERWGVIGPNGAGKTTLIRCLLGLETPTAGEISLGAKLDVGHFEQHRHIDDPEKTVIPHIQSRIKHQTNGEVVLSEQEARNLAGAFLFSGEDQEKQVKVLSGGELARADLAALLSSSKNLLVLDEPTNHLDIQAAERIESVLAQESEDPKTGEKTPALFDGTVILISHDRALLDAVCDNLIVFDDHNATVFPGSYSEYKRHLASNFTPSWTPAAAPTKPAPTSVESAVKSSGPKKKSRFSWMAIDAIEERMGETEAKLSKLDQQLADADIWKDVDHANSVTESRDQLRTELDELEAEWISKSS
ncbi:MAG: ABC-F family ATP-binding cassette domain-containing protein [Phycisphaerales bacterium]